MKADSKPTPSGFAIKGTDLVKLYRRSSAGHQLRTLKSALVQRSLVQGIRSEEAIHAIRDISFEIKPGEAVGLIGSNGSGKSTLLKMAAGIVRPTTGTIDVEGRVAALIELGAGFHPEISGRENIFINGAVLGLSRRELEARYDSIVEFSGLADFIEEPVKNYSSGMYVRLGFAVAIHTDPDVLMVDEVLSVGDEAFGHRCLRRIEEFLARGKTLLLVSHSLSLIEEVCDRAIWLEKGVLKADGHPRRVVDAYREAVADDEGEAHRLAMVSRSEELPEADDPSDEDDHEALRWGSGAVEIKSLQVKVEAEESYHLHCGDAVSFELELEVHQPQEDFVFGIAISTPRGVECWGTNTGLAGYESEALPVGRARVRVDCPSMRLAPGEYLVDVAVHAHDGTPYDYRRQLVALTVTGSERGVGIYSPEHEWQFGQEIKWQREP